jgi:hypothetical protein
MVRVTRIVGVVLIAIGVVAYVVTDFASPTALLPALLGVLIVALGVVAGRIAAGHHAIHAALALALLGGLASLGTVGGIADGDTAAITSLLTVLVCAVYVALGVRSFVAARKARQTTT